MSNPGESVSKGLEGVVAAQTRLSDVRGDIGELIYCGYDINELAGKASFEEVVHLLHYNRLPNKRELAELKEQLAANRELPRGVINILRTLPKDTPPMDALRTGVSALGCFDPEPGDQTYDGQRRKAMSLLARIPIVTAYFHLIRQGKRLPPPDRNLGEAANFLYLLDGAKPSPEKAATVDMCYLYARQPRDERLDIQRARDDRHVERYVFGHYQRHWDVERAAARRRQRGRDQDAHGDWVAGERGRLH